MLQGKGLWAYREEELERALDIAPQMGATHILYKVGQGSSYREGMSQVAQQISAAGLVPLGWMWLLLDDPSGEAQVAVRAFRDGFRGFIFNTEADQCRQRFSEAVQLGQYLGVAGIDPDKLYNCSFPNISHHRDLPYDQMNAFCRGGLMPMAYGTFFAPDSSVPPAQQAERVIDEWTYGHYAYWSRRWEHQPALYPALGPYHGEHGDARMSPAEFQIWLDRLAAYNPSFFSVFTAAVLNDDLLPLIRAFVLGDGVTPVLTSVRVKVVSDAGFLYIRPTPSTMWPPIARVDDGTILEALDPETEVQAKIGRVGQWLRVRIPDGIKGYTAAWYLDWFEEEPAEAEADVSVRVKSPDIGYLNVRPEPSTQRPPVTRVDDGTVLESLESEDATRAKVGRRYEWLHIRTPEGVEGYVYAWYLGSHTKTEGVGKPIPRLVVQSSIGLNVRARPGTDPPIWRVIDRTVLEVVEDQKGVEDKIGKDRWVKVRTPSLHEGFVNGMYVQSQTTADVRKRVNDAYLPRGECAWIFGIHGATVRDTGDFRHLFRDKNKTGCARYVRNSRGCHIWIIGNEQNNVREHPGGAENPIEHITPQMYAEAFNMVWRQIKQVQPGAIVVPGAVDPYNTYPWARLGGRRNRPLEYFKEMLDYIVDLDGIALHTYTHWLDTSLITKRTLFQDPFLQPGTSKEHYYDFQAYRAFAEAIPAKWRDRPIYITETNHWLALEHQPRMPSEEAKIGWVNEDRGWVQAAYKEIDRWNNMPHAQQIQCLLLYRWMGDEWAIRHKGNIHTDIRQALNQDYRWRR